MKFLLGIATLSMFTLTQIENAPKQYAPDPTDLWASSSSIYSSVEHALEIAEASARIDIKSKCSEDGFSSADQIEIVSSTCEENADGFVCKARVRGSCYSLNLS